MRPSRTSNRSSWAGWRCGPATAAPGTASSSPSARSSVCSTTRAYSPVTGLWSTVPVGNRARTSDAARRCMAILGCSQATERRATGSDERRLRLTLETIDFFVYSRAAPGAADVDDDAALDEEHWAYMDRFADGMIARGPTLATDRATWTGSLHIVDLPSVEA